MLKGLNRISTKICIDSIDKLVIFYSLIHLILS